MASVRSRPHPPPDSKRSPKSKMFFLNHEKSNKSAEIESQRNHGHWFEWCFFSDAFGYDCTSKPRQLIQGTAPANGRTGRCGPPSCEPPSTLPQKRRRWASGVLEPCVIMIYDALGNTFCGAHVRPKYSSPFSKFLEKVRDHAIDDPPVFGLHSPASGAKYG